MGKLEWLPSSETIFLPFSRSIHKSAINFSISFPLWDLRCLLAELLSGSSSIIEWDEMTEQQRSKEEKNINFFISCENYMKSERRRTEGIVEDFRDFPVVVYWLMGNFSVGDCWFFPGRVRQNAMQFRATAAAMRSSRWRSFHSSHDDHDLLLLWLLHNFLHEHVSRCEKLDRQMALSRRLLLLSLFAHHIRLLLECACCTFHFSLFIDSINHLMNWLRATIMR